MNEEPRSILGHILVINANVVVVIRTQIHIAGELFGGELDLAILFLGLWEKS